MDDIWAKVANYGFPMVVAVFLLVRIENRLEALANAINRLEQVLTLYLRAPGAEAVSAPLHDNPPAAGAPLAAAER